MKNLSKTSFMFLNTLLFMAVVLYVYFFENTFSTFNGTFCFWTSIVLFLYGIVFYFIDNRKTGEDKNLRNDFNFLLINTLSVTIYLLIVTKNPKLDFGSLSMALVLLLTGNTYYWMVTHLAVLGVYMAKYSNELVQKLQRNQGLSFMAFGLVSILIIFVFQIEDIPNISGFYLLISLLVSGLSNFLTIRATPKNERHREANEMAN